MGKLLNKILRAGEGRTLKKLKVITEQVNALESSFEDMTDEELRAQTDEFKERLADGESLDDLLPEAFATVREAARRTIGQRPYDVQIMGGAARGRARPSSRLCPPISTRSPAKACTL